MAPLGKVAVSALVLLLASAGAAADPLPTPAVPDLAPTHVITEEPRLLCKPPAPPSTCRDLPPGHFVDSLTWAKIDAELRRAQDSETELRAENASLRTATSGWQPGWKLLAGTLLVGVAGGAYAWHKL